VILRQQTSSASADVRTPVAGIRVDITWMIG